MTPEQLAEWASVPRELAEIVFSKSLSHNIDVPSIRSDLKCRHMVAARREIAVEAREQSFSYPKIGRALNRDHTSVRHLVVTA